MNRFDREKLEEELREAGVDYDPDGFRPDFLTRLFLRFWPHVGFKRLNKKLGIVNDVFDKADEVFRGSKRIELYPISGDLKTALYFHQDGDHFKYDGFEMGEYEKGDITIFDDIRHR